MRTPPILSPALLLAAAVFALPASSGEWPSFRGPRFDGSSTATRLPERFAPKENLAWRVRLPGRGDSTPAVWGRAIFLTATDPATDTVLATKIDLLTGAVEWARPFTEGTRHDRRSDYTAPSPTTDGERVVFAAGDGSIAAFDFAGNPLWQLDLVAEHGDLALRWTHASSPVLFNDSVLIQVLRQEETVPPGLVGGPSFLLALDPADGETRWKHLRESQARGESREAYSTPLPLKFRGRTQIVCSGADCLTGHNPSDGSELWRWGTWNRDRVDHWRTISSPVFGTGLILAGAPKGNPVYALPAAASGTLNISATRWISQKPEVSCDVTSPLYYDGLFYLLNGRRRILSCVDPRTGGVHWSETIPARSRMEASPTAADGRIYLVSHLGEIFVVGAGDSFEMRHAVVLGRDPEGKNRASIVPAGESLLVRVGRELLCFRSSPEPVESPRDATAVTR